MSRRGRVLGGASVIVAALLVACGSPETLSARPTATGTAPPTLAQTATPTPAPVTTAAATVNELKVVASMVYPACTPATCTSASMFTTCDSSSPGPDVFTSCPLTTRLAAQLKSDVDGVRGAADPLGGGQDPEWTTKSVTATPSATGGVAHVTLGFGPGQIMATIDLVVVVQGSQLLVDDIYCTGTDPGGTDAYAAGWLTRAVCGS